MVRRQKVGRRRRLFVGCEGESEQSYAALLQDFAKEQGCAVQADPQVVRAGDPLAIVKRAIEKAAQGERGSKAAYSVRFLMLDTDLLGNNPGRDAQIDGLVEQHNFVLLRQNCCFEAFLLRHFAGHANDEAPTAAIALRRLQAVWPQYKKGFLKQELRKRIALEDVQRAAQSPLNADFGSFLDAMGLQPH